MTIDLVYLWCDLADPAFRTKRDAALKKRGLAVKEGDNGACRYLSHDELKYSMRSVEKFMPWIRLVHLVVDDDISLPRWLDEDNPRLRVHRWGRIMPAEKLPCFNSSVFEFFLQDIPGLSERFLYANDDQLATRPVEPSFFFARDGMPIFRYTKSRLDMDAPELEDGYLHRVRESFRFAKANFGVRNGYEKAYGHLGHHCIDGYIKEDLDAFRRAYPEVWDRQTSHPFRDRSQLQREVLAGFAFSLGHAHYRQIRRPWWETAIGLPHRDSWHCSPARRDIAGEFRRIRPSLLCMNDSQDVTEADHIRAHAFLESLFPEPCGFEKKIPAPLRTPQNGGQTLV